MRVFVAVYPPGEIVEDLCSVVDKLALGRAAANGVNVRLAPRDRLHVTLVFLGDVPDQRQEDVASAVGLGVDRAAPFPLRLGGGGRFGRGRFTVLWTGLRGDVDALRDVTAAVRRQMRRARLPFDAKPLQPHLTIARPGDRVPAEDLAADLVVLRAYKSPQWTVEGLRLMRSFPGPTPRYEELGRWRLTPLTPLTPLT